MNYFQHAHAWIPDLLVSLFCFAVYCKITQEDKRIEEPAPAPIKSVYPIPRGRMS